MNAQFAVTSNQLLLAVAIMFVLLIAMIIGGRIILQRRSKKDLAARYRQVQDQHIRARSKYPEVDIFQYTGMFKRVGLIFTLATILFMVNWTTYDKAVYIPDDALLLEEEIAVEPPRTAEPPPPPPPPPPPVIQEVPDEMILEDEDDLEFMDQSIEAESVVEVTEMVTDEVVEDVPPPPPPPPPEEEYEEIFKIVEEMPRFPGCEEMAASSSEKKQCADQKLLEFIYSNIQYPLVARENNIQGNVVLSFVVNRDGSIEQIQVLRDVGAGCGEEAVRVIKLMEQKGIKWIPGKQRGQPVRVQFLLPVKFKLL